MSPRKKKTTKEIVSNNRSSISSAPSFASRKVSEADVLEFKKIFNDQIQTEYALLDRFIDNVFNQAIEALEDCGMGDTIVTPAHFPPGCTLGNGLKIVVNTLQRFPIVQRSSNPDLRMSSRRQSRPENRAVRRSARNRGTSQHSGASSRCQTPSRQRTAQIATVTPLVKHAYNEAPKILRKPRPGETAISMSGSPLHVSSDNVSDTCLIVPLDDGRIFTLEHGANVNLNNLPADLKEEVMGSLADFKAYLSQILR
ncbi:Cell division cycle-associated protein 8 [Nesidiocoris tenuis]|uniref:Cell division cycle-associated protein 8 n=1 Tax=Nesidiocoris tenuis TaxID=355587 RepID=A0ABN7AWJ2_9HEMI|nr:Cell division cycle-associated protein 8 [Nesidiocoris tenuis]